MSGCTNLGSGGAFHILIYAITAISTILTMVNIGIGDLGDKINGLQSTLDSTNVKLDLALADFGEIMQIMEENQKENIKLFANINSNVGKIHALTITMQASVAVIETNILTITALETAMQKQLANIGLKQSTMIDTLSEQLITLRSILAAVEVPLLEKLNAVVHSIEFTGYAVVQWDGDFCENDPFGIGPINCEGVEAEGGSMYGTVFI